jgi:hypothetical protein
MSYEIHEILKVLLFCVFLHGDVIVDLLVIFFMKLMAMATSITDVTTLMNFLHLVCC